MPNGARSVMSDGYLWGGIVLVCCVVLAILSIWGSRGE